MVSILLNMDDQPPVVAMAEIGQMLDLSRRRVAVLIGRPDFPQPVAVLTVSRVWSYDEVSAWAASTDRTVHAITPVTAKSAAEA